MKVEFKLFESDGLTEVYVFPLVQETNLPLSEKRFTELEGFRGEGSIVIMGSESATDIFISGLILGEDYKEITEKIDDLKDKVKFGEPYYLKVNKTESTYYTYRVMRLSPIALAPSLRNGRGAQQYSITFRNKSW